MWPSVPTSGRRVLRGCLRVGGRAVGLHRLATGNSPVDAGVISPGMTRWRDRDRGAVRYVGYAHVFREMMVLDPAPHRFLDALRCIIVGHDFPLNDESLQCLCPT